MMNLYEKVIQSKNYINSKISTKAKVGLILGSGLGSLIDSMEEMTTIDYEDIPNFPKSTGLIVPVLLLNELLDYPFKLKVW